MRAERRRYSNSGHRSLAMMARQGWCMVYESFSRSRKVYQSLAGSNMLDGSFPISLHQRLLPHRLDRLPSWRHAEDGGSRGGEEACIEDETNFTFAMAHRSAKNL